jgi:hypothetical protein
MKYRDLHRQYDAVLRPEAWQSNTAETRQAVAELGSHWRQIVSGRWRAARKMLTAICITTPPADLAADSTDRSI